MSRRNSTADVRTWRLDLRDCCIVLLRLMKVHHHHHLRTRIQSIHVHLPWLASHVIWTQPCMVILVVLNGNTVITSVVYLGDVFYPAPAPAYRRHYCNICHGGLAITRHTEQQNNSPPEQYHSFGGSTVCQISFPLTETATMANEQVPGMQCIRSSRPDIVMIPSSS